MFDTFSFEGELYSIEMFDTYPFTVNVWNESLSPRQLAVAYWFDSYQDSYQRFLNVIQAPRGYLYD